jgi:hypothetical protein
MATTEATKRLCTFLLILGKHEQNLESYRQTLCNIASFEPYAAFRRLDRRRNGFLSAEDIARFLRDNQVDVAIADAAFYINANDNDQDGNLSYSEYSRTTLALIVFRFLRSLLPQDNPELRTIASLRANYDIAIDEMMEDEVEYALSRLLQR